MFRPFVSTVVFLPSDLVVVSFGQTPEPFVVRKLLENCAAVDAGNARGRTACTKQET